MIVLVGCITVFDLLLLGLALRGTSVSPWAWRLSSQTENPVPGLLTPSWRAEGRIFVWTMRWVLSSFRATAAWCLSRTPGTERIAIRWVCCPARVQGA